MSKKNEEICPTCSREGDESPKEFTIKKHGKKMVKEYSCGHETEIVNSILELKNRKQIDQIKKFLKQK